MKPKGYVLFHRNDDKKQPWLIRYRETINEAGTLRTIHRKRILCPATVRTADAEKLAEQEIKKLVASRPTKPELIVTLGDYVTRVYLPDAELKLRGWTVRSYRSMWEQHFAPRLHITGTLLCDVDTPDVRRWLEEIFSVDKTEDGGLLGKSTAKRMKSLLSGIFTHAKNWGYMVQNSVNPVKGAILPEGAEPRATVAYDLEQIRAMIAAVNDPTARTMIALCAFTGISRSEVRGLQWEDWTGDELQINRSIVGGAVQPTKTAARRAPVPLLPDLVRVLAQHRARDGNPTTGPIFRTSKASPVDPNNLLRDQMQPAFKRAGITFWEGWHGLRRGLASNLYRLKVPDLVIQRILRHSNVAVTQACYIKTVNDDSMRALESLNAVLCPSCALEEVNTEGMKLQ